MIALPLTALDSLVRALLQTVALVMAQQTPPLTFRAISVTVPSPTSGARPSTSFTGMGSFNGGSQSGAADAWGAPFPNRRLGFFVRIAWRCLPEGSGVRGADGESLPQRQQGPTSPCHETPADERRQQRASMCPRMWSAQKQARDLMNGERRKHCTVPPQHNQVRQTGGTNQ